jgi:hypothetical protein
VDYLVWNEFPTVVGNLVGGLTFVGLTLYATHARPGAGRTRPAREDVRTPEVAAR